MNLIEDAWLKFRTPGGGFRFGSPAVMADPEVVDLALPRADFQGAAWQFLIGLLQTAMPPENVEEWQASWHSPPTEDALAKRLRPWQPAFELFGGGPRFMQDLDPLTDARSASVGTLLIDAPGDQGIRFNTDHFVKRGIGEVMCPSCAAMALFTLQINAPSGGKGYRTGLRGGGPITTLVLPHDEAAPLWRKLWLNVLARTELSFEPPSPRDERLIPWLGPTRTSARPGSETRPEHVHPLHVYWAMPRRFRLEVDETSADCRICGWASEKSVSRIRATNYGFNYAGHWRHPLTPYRQDSKKPEEPPLSIKGQKGGLGYRHWESLVLADPEGSGSLPALVVQDYLANKQDALQEFGPVSRHTRLWAFGYDMDNMKPRGWYTTRMPLVSIPSEAAHDRLHDWVRLLVEAAEKAAWRTRGAVKEAWFKRPQDARGDFGFIDQRVWESTEEDFYAALARLPSSLESGDPQLPAPIARRWRKTLSRAVQATFDDLALSGDAEALDLKRVTTARRGLERWLNTGKEMKSLKALAKEDEAA